MTRKWEFKQKGNAGIEKFNALCDAQRQLVRSRLAGQGMSPAQTRHGIGHLRQILHAARSTADRHRRTDEWRRAARALHRRRRVHGILRNMQISEKRMEGDARRRTNRQLRLQREPMDRIRRRGVPQGEDEIFDGNGIRRRFGLDFRLGRLYWE